MLGPSWGNVDGNAVFNGDVTMLVVEACELFLRLPGEGLAFVFNGGLPTFRLGSSLPLGAARFFAVPPPSDCFDFSFNVLVTGGTVTSIFFAISDTRLLVDSCGIACNWFATDTGSISGPRTVDDIGLGTGEVSLVDVDELELLVCTGPAGKGTNPGKEDCLRLPLETLPVFGVSAVALASDVSVGVFTVDGFLPLCLGVEG